MNEAVILKLENIIKRSNREIYYEYLKVVKLYKFFIECIFEFSLEDKLGIAIFFHEKILKNKLEMYEQIFSEESNVFLTNKIKEENFKLALEYCKNRCYGLDHIETIELIENNKLFYSKRIVDFLEENSHIILELYELAKEKFVDRLEEFSNEKDYYITYEDENCEIILIKKNIHNDFSPSFFSREGVTLRFCKKGQVGFKKEGIVLGENEVLVNSGIYLGEYKVLTSEIEYIILYVKESFLKKMNIKLDENIIKKIPFKINSESFEIFKNLEGLENRRLIILDFLVRLAKDVLKEKNSLEFKRILDSSIEKITKYIDDNLETPLSVNELQSLFGYNKNSLIELFKNNYGVSPLKYILNKKLERSSVFLLEGELSVGEIWLKLNFSSASKFSQQFKEKYLETPYQFRKKYAKLEIKK